MISPSHQLFRDARKVVVFKDKRRPSEYRANNTSQKSVIGYAIDGGLISGSTSEKCDFGLEIESEKRVIFVELKGADLCKACNQILQTIKLLSSSLSEYSISARIVLTKTSSPDIRSNDYKVLSKVLRNHNGNLEQRTRLLEEFI